MTPCPFCGATEADLEVEKRHEYRYAFYRVRCSKCDAYGPATVLRQDAIDGWNERKETTT